MHWFQFQIKKYSGHIHYISRTADELTRNFKVQIKLKNPENKIISGLSSEVEIGTTSEDAFISSSLISLDNKGIFRSKSDNREKGTLSSC